MEKAYSFLDRHPDVAFATVDLSCKPRIRMLRVLSRTENNLCFAVTPHKAVLVQLRANPYAELLVSEGTISVRMAGVIHFDLTMGECREIFRENDRLKETCTDPAGLVWFRMAVHKIDHYDQSCDPPLLESSHF